MVNSSVSTLWKAYGWVHKILGSNSFQTNTELFVASLWPVFFFIEGASSVLKTTLRFTTLTMTRSTTSTKSIIIIFIVICMIIDHHQPRSFDVDPLLAWSLWNDHHDHQDYHDHDDNVCRRSSCLAATVTNPHRAPLCLRVAPWFLSHYHHHESWQWCQHIERFDYQEDGIDHNHWNVSAQHGHNKEMPRVFSCSCTQMTRMSIQASRESEFKIVNNISKFILIFIGIMINWPAGTCSCPPRVPSVTAGATSRTARTDS